MLRPTTAIQRTSRVACATTTTLGSRLWLLTPAISEPKADSIWPLTRNETMAEPDGPVLLEQPLLLGHVVGGKHRVHAGGDGHLGLRPRRSAPRQQAQYEQASCTA